MDGFRKVSPGDARRIILECRRRKANPDIRDGYWEKFLQMAVDPESFPGLDIRGLFSDGRPRSLSFTTPCRGRLFYLNQLMALEKGKGWGRMLAEHVVGRHRNIYLLANPDGDEKVRDVYRGIPGLEELKLRNRDWGRFSAFLKCDPERRASFAIRIRKFLGNAVFA